MDLLYLSHCVPNPPDKGERIRAHHQVAYLAERYRVHLVCFARGKQEVVQARELEGRCASVYVEGLSTPASAIGALVRFGLGACLTTSFYSSRTMRRHVEELAGRVPLSAVVAYSSAMAPYAPAGTPLLLDMVDVDSEKWVQYSRMRQPGIFYGLEGRRLRRLETEFAYRAGRTLLATGQEEDLLRSFAPGALTSSVENGVDFEYFDPARTGRLAEVEKRRYVAFVGAMDYFPNADAARWFVDEVYPEVRRRNPGMEFLVVGRNPTGAVWGLGRREGITVTGSVPDVRPYLASAVAVVAPLRIARGIQNKVLEALAMGKPVAASPAVCETLGPRAPAGVMRCESGPDYAEAIAAIERMGAGRRAEIRQAARRRFSWEAHTGRLSAALEEVMGAPLAEPAEAS